MSTTMAMPFVVDGPLPAAPPHSLLNVRYTADDEVRTVLLRPGDDRWANGVQVYGYPVDLPASWDPCSTGTFRDKEEGDEFPTPMFGSFAVYLPITCSAGYIGDPDEFGRRAERALDATLSYGVARALSQGVAAPSSNPFFADPDVTFPAGVAAVPAQTGLSYLENAIGGTGRLGMIHATPAVAAAWGYGAGIGPVSPEGLHSPNGNPIAADGGYIGATPTTGGAAAAAAGQSWTFATGPVEVRVADVAVYEIAQVLDRDNNDVTYRAERYVVASWDTALQAAVLIDWSP